MTNTTKAKISRGMHKSYKRRRMSAAMKAVWERRRALGKPDDLNVDIRPTRLLDVATRILGYKEVKRVLKEAVNSKLESL